MVMPDHMHIRRWEMILFARLRARDVLALDRRMRDAEASFIGFRKRGKT